MSVASSSLCLCETLQFIIFIILYYEYIKNKIWNLYNLFSVRTFSKTIWINPVNNVCPKFKYLKFNVASYTK